MRHVRVLLRLLPLLFSAALSAADSHAAPGAYEHPAWDRRDQAGSRVHALLEKAAQLHQAGELEEAVKALKQAIGFDKQNGEAHASLCKLYSDLGKPDLAAKAMAKATKIHNQQLAAYSLF
jgi:Tfp pilus assembly protein PilF